jgi:hypothetical protein
MRVFELARYASIFFIKNQMPARWNRALALSIKVD